MAEELKEINASNMKNKAKLIGRLNSIGDLGTKKRMSERIHEKSRKSKSDLDDIHHTKSSPGTDEIGRAKKALHQKHKQERFAAAKSKQNKGMFSAFKKRSMSTVGQEEEEGEKDDSKNFEKNLSKKEHKNPKIWLKKAVLAQERVICAPKKCPKGPKLPFLSNFIFKLLTKFKQKKCDNPKIWPKK